MDLWTLVNGLREDIDIGGARHSTQETTTNWPTWLQQPVEQYAQGYQNLAMPGGQIALYNPALNQQTAPFNVTQQGAFGNILGTAGQAQGVAGAAGQNVQDTLQGRYLDPSSNPWLRSTYDQAAQGVSDQYKYATAPSTMATTMGNGGTFGGTSFGDTSMLQRYGLGQNLSNLATSIYGGNYSQERGNQLQAAGMTPQTIQGMFMPGQAALGVGSLQQQQTQTGLDTQQQNAMRQFQYPFTVMDELGQALGTARGPAGQSSTLAPNRAGWLK